MMTGLLKAVLTGIVFSCYYFPFEFTFLPGINTKMMLAVIGAALFVMQWHKEDTLRLNRTFLVISVWAVLFSLSSFLSVVINNTTDYTYVSFIVGLWVWIAGAYSVMFLIRKVHGSVSIQWVFRYMAYVCAIQSILAILIDNMPLLQEWVDGLILQDVEFLHRVDRLYGIGASFDTAGIRFSCAMLGLGYLIVHEISDKRKIWYWSLFLIIGIVGNIVSRTTTVGLVISIVYMALSNFSLNGQITRSRVKFIGCGIVLTGLLVGGGYYLYNYSPVFGNYLRYGFEGFFNWFENGEWTTNSTDRLQRMVVFPDNLKTWLIGDGWFLNPDDSNGFYKYVDIGYLNFIFYCGTIGVAIFISLFVHSTYLLCQKGREDTFFFLLLLLLQLIVWIKISTNIFLVYAMLLLLDSYESSEDSVRPTEKTPYDT